MIRTFIICSLLGVGLSEFEFRHAQSQVVWKPIATPKAEPSPVIWKATTSDSDKPEEPSQKWEEVAEPEDQNQPPEGLVWEVLESADEALIPAPQTASNSVFTPPSSLEEAEALLDIVPLNPSDYQPLLRLSPLVSTAETLPMEQWRIAFGMISPFESDAGTGNQNYSANLDIGLNDNLLLSLFVSQADDPLNAPLNGFATQPDNFWQSYGAAARWQVMNENNWTLAISGSIESWEVGSGGDNSLANSGDDASPNIFNDSGSRVFTRNIVGSLSVPLSWQTSEKWQLSFNPGVSFLPETQGAGQGGAGRFYGTNPYVSGGVLFQPIPELTLTASIARPIGSGTNSFDANLKFSRIPIYSAGINWDLNPRIGLQGLITNGFGTTPATALLALPSDNRLGYSANFVYTPGTADTPSSVNAKATEPCQRRANSEYGPSPADGTSEAWVNADNRENFNYFFGHSISNVFQLNLFTSAVYKNVPQTTEYSQNFANDDTWNWRVGGKAVTFQSTQRCTILGRRLHKHGPSHRHS